MIKHKFRVSGVHKLIPINHNSYEFDSNPIPYVGNNPNHFSNVAVRLNSSDNINYTISSELSEYTFMVCFFCYSSNRLFYILLHIDDGFEDEQEVDLHSFDPGVLIFNNDIEKPLKVITICSICDSLPEKNQSESTNPCIAISIEEETVIHVGYIQERTIEYPRIGEACNKKWLSVIYFGDSISFSGRFIGLPVTLESDYWRVSNLSLSKDMILFSLSNSEVILNINNGSIIN